MNSIGAQPNLVELNNALHQTGWEGPAATPDNWRDLVEDKLEGLDWNKARREVAPFLEMEQDIEQVSPEVLRPLLSQS